MLIVLNSLNYTDLNNHLLNRSLGRSRSVSGSLFYEQGMSISEIN